MSRQARIVEDLLALDGDVPLIERLALTAMGRSKVSGCGISVMADGSYQTTLCRSGDLGHIEELQFIVGEGPCLGAHAGGEPISAPDLLAEIRWPAFSRAAVEAGARAVFSFPLHVGAARIAVLSLFRDQPGELTTDQYADVLVVVELLIISILTVRAGLPDEPGQLTANGSSQYWQVHQASGMVSVQLDIPIEEALLRLRAHAFATDAPISELAADVVARRFRFHPTGPAVP